MSRQAEALRLLAARNAVVTNDHFVYKAGDHGAVYVNKDAVYPNTYDLLQVCQWLAEPFFEGAQVDVVVGPALGGILLSSWTAHALAERYSHRAGESEQVLSVYAEKGPDGGFVIKRGYDKLVAGKCCLVVEDILTTGDSAKAVVEAVRLAGGEIIAVSAICNRGGVTAAKLGVPRLEVLATINLDKYPADACPLCQRGIPINTELGHGRDYLRHIGAAVQ